MAARRTKFYIDPHEGKIRGVCAGIADYTGIDVTFVRVGAVVLALTTHLIALGAYFLIAWLAEEKPEGLYGSPEDAQFWQGVRSNPKRSAAEVRARFRDVDRRLADIETFYTSRNTELASEIDKLR